ncbi:MAG: hypothetical protein K0R29_2497 [Pseudobdellovibrio sp.]|jgi:hypothetical protein|nr:hypothetical protein [Pseudobdellovibrio sp.]
MSMLRAVSVFLVTLVVFAASSFAAPPPRPVHPKAEDYRWLYEALFAQSDRNLFPAESFISFYVHMYDSDEFLPSPELISADQLRQVTRLEGMMGYVNGIIKKRYVYDVETASEIIFHVRVHFKDPAGEDVENFRAKVAAAENIWNASRIVTNFPYRFQFEVVENAADAHYSVKVLDKTRGPYDMNWGRDWTPTTIAHELGHMMGIADEYQTLSSYQDCLKTSLMCSSSNGKLMPHHYYFILRRLVVR